uniref:Kinesin-like protein KIF6/9 C-terminal domain-containing protein n=1 Tax=Otus sunia TaxID=257818 RepID=A0A8C8EDG3_9STRI
MKEIQKQIMSLGCQEAFEVFKRDHADSITIDDNNQLLKQSSDNSYFLSFTDHLKGKITQRHIQRAALGSINFFSYTCWKICNTLSLSHISYKTMFNRLKELKVEIEHLQLLMEKVKVKLQKDFEVWWSEELRTKLHNWFLYNFLLNFSFTRLYHLCLLLEYGSQKTVSRILNGTGKGAWLLSAAKLTSETCTLPCGLLQKITCSLTPPSSSTSIPLTGDSQADADILAFIKARQNILQKKGKSCQKIGSQTKTSSTVF